MSFNNIVQWILQFLEEGGFLESKHKLESESAIFLDIVYVKTLIREGAWDDLKKYLSSFPGTRKIVCLILKHKYLEAIKREDYNAATVILSEEMDKSDYGDGLFSELTMLLTTESLRENPKYACYSDTLSGRQMAYNDLKKLIQGDPILLGKTQFPIMERSLLMSQIKGKTSECVRAHITRPSELRSTRICVGSGFPVKNMRYKDEGAVFFTLFANGAYNSLSWDNELKTYNEYQLQDTDKIFGSELDFGDACFSFSVDGRFVALSSGKQITFFQYITQKIQTLRIPVAATVIAFHPTKDGHIAIGTQNQSVYIWYPGGREILKGHLRAVSGLAFSDPLQILASAANGGEVFIWDSTTWLMKAKIALDIPLGREKKSKTGLMFDRDQSKMVVVHQSQLTLYDASSSNCISKWVPEKLSVQIEDAAFSGGYNIYALLVDGRVCVLSYPGLILSCIINMTAYVDGSISPAPYPKAIAAHPVEVDRIAVGLTNGDVFVLEPRGWGSTRVAEL